MMFALFLLSISHYMECVYSVESTITTTKTTLVKHHHRQKVCLHTEITFVPGVVRRCTIKGGCQRRASGGDREVEVFE